MSAVLNIPAIDPSSLSRSEAVRPLTIIVAGNPNAGKTSLFNSLTGLRQKVANYPGVTVESKSGHWSISSDLPPARLIDLPGLYSLDATSLDEKIASDILLDRAQADAIIVVVDATNLVRNLYLAMQLIETGQPIVIALTMFDLAERSKLKIDVESLSAGSRVPVIPVVAKRGRGLKELADAVLKVTAHQPLSEVQRLRFPNASVVSFPKPGEENAAQRQSNLIRRYARIESIVSDAVETTDAGKPGISERIDRFVT